MSGVDFTISGVPVDARSVMKIVRDLRERSRRIDPHRLTYSGRSSGLD